MGTEKNFGDAAYSQETVKLIRAVLDNDLYQARKAIHRGANVRVRGRNNDTLLHVCSSASMAAILLNHHAIINAENDFKQIPLHTSMRRGLVRLSGYLIDQGADINAQELDGTAPLHLTQNPNINRIILDKGANPNIQNSAGDTPLHLAVREKGNPIVDELMSRGADKSIRNVAGHNVTDEFVFRVGRATRELNAMRKLLNIPEVASSISTPAANNNSSTTSAVTASKTDSLLFTKQQCKPNPASLIGTGSKYKLR